MMTRSQYDAISARFPHPHDSFDRRLKYKFTFPKSDNRDEILQYIIDSHFVEGYVLNLVDYNDEDVDDKIQEIYLALSEVPQSRWTDLCNQGYSTIKAFVSGLIYRQIHSGTSTTYFKYGRYHKRFPRLSDKAWKTYSNTNSSIQINNLNSSDETEERD